MTLIGVAVGLGNIWRFPYMVGKFGGAAFVLFYLLVVVLVGIPALMAEWTLGRHTRLGTVGAFQRAGLPLGRPLGWFFFFVVTAATGYYLNVLGWVLHSAAGQLATGLGLRFDPDQILPPPTGFSGRALELQLLCTGGVVLASVAVLRKGVRRGAEAISRIVMPGLLVVLLVLIARALTLPGAWEGVRWYIFKFDVADLTPRVMMAALGQAIFSLSLGGTFMVVYGSYLAPDEPLRANAIVTAAGDTAAGLLAGLAIIPAVFALGLEPGSGPGLLFETLPEVFARIPAGWVFGTLFFGGLFSAAFLSGLAAFEVLVAGLTDNTSMERRRSVWLMAGAAYLLAIPPMINLRIFVPWDLTFGSGMQTLGALLAVVTVGWCLHRSAVLAQLGAGGERGLLSPVWLVRWLRFVVPGAILLVGLWWLATDVFGFIGGV